MFVNRTSLRHDLENRSAIAISGVTVLSASLTRTSETTRHWDKEPEASRLEAIAGNVTVLVDLRCGCSW